MTNCVLITDNYVELRKRARKILEVVESRGYRFPYSGLELSNLQILYGEMCWFDRVIFDHRFAEKLFGNSDTCNYCGKNGFSARRTDDYLTGEIEVFIECVSCYWQPDDNYPIQKAWQYHLQRLVLLETPKERIEYMEQFI